MPVPKFVTLSYSIMNENEQLKVKVKGNLNTHAFHFIDAHLLLRGTIYDLWQGLYFI
jgi:hypothetical protein